MIYNLVARCCTIHVVVLFGMLCTPVCMRKYIPSGMGMDAIFLYCLCHVIDLRCVLTGTADPVASNGPVTKEIYSI